MQVTALLRRVLPEVPPSLFASLVGVEALPSTDYGILQCFDASASWTLERVGILDVLLACIAKALTLQVKTKGRDKETSSKQVVTSVTMATIFDEGHPLGSRWWMRGSMPRRVAESIIQLVKDMASVRLFGTHLTVRVFLSPDFVFDSARRACCPSRGRP